MENVDCVVVGGGVVGLACARALALAGREVIVLEAANRIGGEISSRNSEVIHAGIYYPAGSLKATLCVRGKALLYDYCKQFNIAYRQCGKLIVATSQAQVATLADIAAGAAANGVHDLRQLGPAEVAELEPAIRCDSALLSPSTGILDSHGFMLSLLGELESHGGWLASHSVVSTLQSAGPGVNIQLAGEDSPALCAQTVVNAAGHSAIALASSCHAIPAGHLPAAVLAKGSYFGLTGKAPVSRLVYPVPEPGGLGVHITLDLMGRVRFGPDVEWVDDFDYEVDHLRAENFYRAIRLYWPKLPDNALVADYAGIRPKISYNSELFTDFVISGPAQHGVAGLINLFGIESPGLTSSLAIAEAVAAIANR